MYILLFKNICLVNTSHRLPSPAIIPVSYILLLLLLVRHHYRHISPLWTVPRRSVGKSFVDHIIRVSVVGIPVAATTSCSCSMIKQIFIYFC